MTKPKKKETIKVENEKRKSCTGHLTLDYYLRKCFFHTLMCISIECFVVLKIFVISRKTRDTCLITSNDFAQHTILCIRLKLIIFLYKATVNNRGGQAFHTKDQISRQNYIFGSAYVLIIPYSHECWIMNEKVRSRI